MTVQTVPMVNIATGKPADVHPDEVVNWKKFGWRERDADLSPVPPPPPPVSAPKVVELPKDWTAWRAAELRTVVESMTGRTPDNREQAMQVILAAIQEGRAKLV